MIEVITGSTVLLELVLADGDTTRFPQAEIYDNAGVAIAASPVNLSHIADGLYQGTFTAPAVGEYSVIYITYSDAARTIVVGNIERVSEHMRVTNAVQDDVWAELLPGAFGAGTAGNIIGNNVDATISSRSTLTQADILSDATPFAGALIPNLDATVSSRSTLVQADILSDATPFAGANIDATISSRGTADPGDAMTLTAGERTAIDTQLSGTHGAGNWESASATDWTGAEKQQIRQALGVTGLTAATAAGELQAVLADTAAIEPLVSTNLDATVSSRSTLAQADILSDATPFPGADIDATISSRSSHTAADVDTVITASHGAGSYQTATGFAVAGDDMGLTAAGVDAVWDEPLAGHLTAGTTGKALDDAGGGASPGTIAAAVWAESLPGAFAAGEAGRIVGDNVDAAISSRSTLAQADILSDATPFPGADIDATISSRSSHTPADVDTTLSASHGAGSWVGTSLTQQNVRDAMKLSPTAGAPSAGSVDEHLDTIEADTAAIEPLVTANLDAAVSSRAVPGDAMTLTAGERAAIDTELSGTHGAGLWESASDVDWTDPEKEQIRQALGVTGATAATAAGELQAVLADTAAIEPVVTTNLDVAVSTRATPGDAMSLDAAGVDAIFDESLSGHLGAGTAGQALAAAFGNAGGNVRDDALTYDANNRPLTLRRRIFPDAATANASTPGGVGEGEIITVTISATQIDAAKWETLLRTI